MAEGLGEVPEQFAGDGVNLLGKQAEIVGGTRQAIKERVCPLDLAGLGQAGD